MMRQARGDRSGQMPGKRGAGKETRGWMKRKRREK
jgi:hypothetical protein